MLRTSKFKSVSILLALLAIVLVLAACAQPAPGAGGEQAADGDRPRIVFVTPLFGHPVWLEAKRGAEDAAAEAGYDLEWVGPNTIDIDAQIQQLEIALATDADGVLSTPLNPEAFLGIYDQYQEAGIPIVNVQVDTPEETRLSFIGTGASEYGVRAADVLAEQMGGEANVAVLMTSLDTGNQVLQLEAFRERIAEAHPGIEVTVVETNNSDMAIAVDKINQILLTYPEVDAFLMLVGEGAPAAAQVLEEQNRTDITVLGIDDLPETLDAIREGWVWGSLNQNYYVMGYEGTMLIVNHLEGEEVPSVVDSGTTLITAENVDTYKDESAE